MQRTTICLEPPILRRVREKAYREGKTLKVTLSNLIILGLNRAGKASAAHPPELPTLNLGRELADISDRTRLYEIWEKHP